MRRVLFLILGWLALALGVIGIPLPGLPTTPFLILAAFAFSRGSPKTRAWLVDHAHLGPMIRDWEERGAISRRAKVMAATMMAAVVALSFVLGAPGWAIALQVVMVGGAAVFVLSRPE